LCQKDCYPGQLDLIEETGHCAKSRCYRDGQQYAQQNTPGGAAPIEALVCTGWENLQKQIIGPGH
jgi:hypothetical protein